MALRRRSRKSGGFLRWVTYQPPEPLEVTWYAYVVLVGTYNNNNYYDVIEYLYNVKA